MNLYKFLRVAFLRVLSRHILVDQFCHRCGTRGDIIWCADDSLWIGIMGSHGGVLCANCFDRECRSCDVMILWRPEVQNDCIARRFVKQAKEDHCNELDRLRAREEELVGVLRKCVLWINDEQVDADFVDDLDALLTEARALLEGGRDE